jgi:hypothetical protein
MIEIRFDKTKDEVALLIWFLVDHSVYHYGCSSKYYHPGYYLNPMLFLNKHQKSVFFNRNCKYVHF